MGRRAQMRFGRPGCSRAPAASSRMRGRARRRPHHVVPDLRRAAVGPVSSYRVSPEAAAAELNNGLDSGSSITHI
jgi:hypothetical protein